MAELTHSVALRMQQRLHNAILQLGEEKSIPQSYLLQDALAIGVPLVLLFRGPTEDETYGGYTEDELVKAIRSYVLLALDLLARRGELSPLLAGRLDADEASNGFGTQDQPFFAPDVSEQISDLGGAGLFFATPEQ